MCVSVCLCVCVGVVGEVEPMDSEDEAASDADEMMSVMVSVGADCVPFSEVTPDMVATMTDSQKHEYIRIGQQLYDQLNH